MERKAKTEGRVREANGRGLFVVIEGQDGTGKTTLAREIVAALSARGIVALGTREPSGVFGQRVREAAREGRRLEPWEEMAHFCMARAQHWHDVIEPALAQGIVVVCDRWLYSTLAYNVPRIEQAHGEASGQRAWEMALGSGVRADVCVCLLVSEEAREARLATRRAACEARGEPMDAFDALPNMRPVYEAVCAGKECVRFDGGGVRENVERAMLAILHSGRHQTLLTVRGLRTGWDEILGPPSAPRWQPMAADDALIQGRLPVDPPQPVQMAMADVLPDAGATARRGGGDCGSR